MSKFDHIFQDPDKLLEFAEDLENVANKYELTFLTCFEDEGALVAHFDELDSEDENEDAE